MIKPGVSSTDANIDCCGVGQKLRRSILVMGYMYMYMYMSISYALRTGLELAESRP